MRYGSVCSGIEAATKAWHVLGWEPSFFSEIEAFPSAVLQHHYPSVPNLGDMTKFEEWPDHAIDLLVGGTPCQSFSVAGLRGGLDDARGNLMLTYGAIARRYRPRWLVWENVPGVLSSDGGRDFASLLGLLSGRRVQVPADGWRNAGIVEGYKGAYGLAWRVLDAQYVRVDGFEHAVPQRRRRVFVVGYSGDWRRAAAVLFEPEGLRGDSAPRRQAGKRAATTISSRPSGGGGLGTDFDLDGGLVVDAAARCVTAGYAQRLDWETENFVAHAAAPFAPAITKNPYGDHESRDGLLVAHSLRAEGFDASEDGTGRGTPIVPIPLTLAIRGRDGEPDIEWRQDGTSNAILTPNGGRAGVGVGAVAHAIQAGALRENPESGPDGVGVQADIAYTLEARAEVQAAWAVRRLTPTECARLQGFPDNHCRIPWRGKPAELCPDGPQYKAYGNSMAVNAMRWLGQRIQQVENLSEAA